MSTNVQKGFGQTGIMDAGWREAKAGQKAHWGDGHQHVEAHVGTDAAAPAFVRHASQPPASSAFDGTNWYPSGIQDLVEFFALVWSLLSEQTGHLFDEPDAGVLLPHELAVVGQARKRRFQVTLGKAVKGPLAGKPCPLSKQRKRDDFADTQVGLGSWVLWLGEALLLAEVIHHDIQCGQKGIQVFHCKLLFECLELTFAQGYLSFQTQPLITHTKRSFLEERMFWSSSFHYSTSCSTKDAGDSTWTHFVHENGA